MTRLITPRRKKFTPRIASTEGRVRHLEVNHPSVAAAVTGGTPIQLLADAANFTLGAVSYSDFLVLPFTTSDSGYASYGTNPPVLNSDSSITLPFVSGGLSLWLVTLKLTCVVAVADLPASGFVELRDFTSHDILASGHLAKTRPGTDLKLFHLLSYVPLFLTTLLPSYLLIDPLNPGNTIPHTVSASLSIVTLGTLA